MNTRLTLIATVVATLLTSTSTGQGRGRNVEERAWTCDPRELVQSVRELIGPEKPRTFPTPTGTAPGVAPGLLAPTLAETCNLPETVCTAQREAEAAARRAELRARIRGQVLALERCGY